MRPTSLPRLVLPIVIMASSCGDAPIRTTSPAPVPAFVPPRRPLDGPVVVASSTPPPISGGTMSIIANGRRAVVADVDRDQLLVVDLDHAALLHTISLQPGDQPGRSVEDTAGRLHLLARGSGALVRVDPNRGEITARRSVCADPRGIAYDPSRDAVHVACAGGELITFPAASGDATRQLQLDLDLRDVVVDGEQLLVSRFRSAELLVVQPSGEVTARLRPPATLTLELAEQGDVIPPADAPRRTRTREAAVAWRTVAAPGGGAVMAFQYEQTSEVQPSAGGYGDAVCASVVVGAVAWLRQDGSPVVSPNLPVVLPVDVAIDPVSLRVLVASAGIGSRDAIGPDELHGPAWVFTAMPTRVDDGASKPLSVRAPSVGELRACDGTEPIGGPVAPPSGRVVAVGFDAVGRVVLQTREPSAVIIGDRTVALPGVTSKDTGHEIFHMATKGGLACASCHPEGREDGHVWTFANLGPRRTQSLGGGILESKPFHWDGDLTDFDTLAHEVFTQRMAGPSLDDAHIAALATWIDHIPAWKRVPAADPADAERGERLFNDARIGCATCHGGPRWTDNTNASVGTHSPAEPSGRFQVPSLQGLRWRAPFMHDGCAATLADRFRPECGGGDEHGLTSQLSAAEVRDLVSYLNTL